MKAILMFVLVVILLIFLVMPAALGYWYIAQDTQAFEIPFRYWVIPSLLVVLSLVIPMFLNE